MKKFILNLGMVLALSVMLTSCYTYTTVVGNGAQGNTEVTKKNHYLIYGLVDLDTSDAKAMADGASDYTITIEHTFVDGLLNAITFGIYTPTTTTVRK